MYCFPQSLWLCNNLMCPGKIILFLVFWSLCKSATQWVEEAEIKHKNSNTQDQDCNGFKIKHIVFETIHMHAIAKWKGSGKMSPRKPLMPNYGPKAFLCMTTPLFVGSIANCKEVSSSFFAILLCTFSLTTTVLQILHLDLIFWSSVCIQLFLIER